MLNNSTKPANTLAARFSETMPEAEDRPIRDNAAVREEATRRILPAVSNAIPGVLLDHLEAALQASTRWGNDTQDIANKLTHRLNVQSNDALLKALDGLSYEIDVCHEMMVKSWVRVRKIVPAFSEGDEVIATMQEGYFKVRSVHGFVVAIEADVAKYTVKTREHDKFVTYTVPFEDVVRRGETANQESVAAGEIED